MIFLYLAPYFGTKILFLLDFMTPKLLLFAQFHNHFAQKWTASRGSLNSHLINICASFAQKKPSPSTKTPLQNRASTFFS